MFTDTDTTPIRGELLQTTERHVWVWQALAAGLFMLWLLTLSFGYFRSQLVEWQAMGLMKDQLIQAVQQLGQSVQTLSKEQQSLTQRMQALEGRAKGDEGR